MTFMDIARCLVVSLVISLLAPLVDSALNGPAVGEKVFDFSAAQVQALAAAESDEQFERLLVQAAATEPVQIESGSDSLTYAFGHPQFGYLYFWAVVQVFPWVFGAALISSFWSTRALRQGLASGRGV